MLLDGLTVEDISGHMVGTVKQPHHRSPKLGSHRKENKRRRRRKRKRKGKRKKRGRQKLQEELRGGMKGERGGEKQGGGWEDMLRTCHNNQFGIYNTSYFDLQCRYQAGR